jgi:hypothetical protein
MKEQKLISKAIEDSLSFEPFKEEISSGWEIVSYVVSAKTGDYRAFSICVTALLERIIVKNVNG